MSGPQVAIDLGRIERNTRTIVERCALSGIKVFGVTKGTCGMPQVARAMLRGGVSGIAESRFENIRRLRDSGINAPIMLLRSPPMARVEEVVRTVDISLQSELTTIREISRIAERMGRVHDIMLMIDLGDLREGIWPSDCRAKVSTGFPAAPRRRCRCCSKADCRPASTICASARRSCKAASKPSATRHGRNSNPMPAG